MNSFNQRVSTLNPGGIRRKRLETLQFNLGKLCNLTCSHCHVEAGPSKTVENAGAETVDWVIEALDRLKPLYLDLTGGAPEMNPHFRRLVAEARARNIRVIDRCNLTVFFEAGHEDLPAFLSSHEVIVVASLPCYDPHNVDKQRGRGVYDLSIQALKQLNAKGYGIQPGLELNLVYNPTGPYLPPDQKNLEAEYKSKLRDEHGIYFNHLYTITNMPITRYRKFLEVSGSYESYTHLLEQNFRVENLEHLMCRNTLSVDWRGLLYDCDFNQVLNLTISDPGAQHIRDVQLHDLEQAAIVTDSHCFGCTAGSGSSCSGSLHTL